MSDAADLQLPAVRERPAFGAVVPAIVADTHRDAGERFVEFFAANIRNANTRAAYRAPGGSLRKGRIAHANKSSPPANPPKFKDFLTQ
jgi:hypothetical protein